MALTTNMVLVDKKLFIATHEWSMKCRVHFKRNVFLIQLDKEY